MRISHSQITKPRMSSPGAFFVGGSERGDKNLATGKHSRHGKGFAGWAQTLEGKWLLAVPVAKLLETGPLLTTIGPVEGK